MPRHIKPKPSHLEKLFGHLHTSEQSIRNKTAHYTQSTLPHVCLEQGEKFQDIFKLLMQTF